MDVLLADPCWGPGRLDDALYDACDYEEPAVVERLLADPRVRLSTAVADHSKSDASCFQRAAGNGRAEVLVLLLADSRLHRLDKVAVGHEIVRGLYRLIGGVVNAAKCTALRKMLSSPAVLHACAAAFAAPGASFPIFLRNGINMAHTGLLAWVRRRQVVAARVRLLEEE